MVPLWKTRIFHFLCLNQVQTRQIVWFQNLPNKPALQISYKTLHMLRNGCVSERSGTSSCMFSCHMQGWPGKGPEMWEDLGRKLRSSGDQRNGESGRNQNGRGLRTERVSLGRPPRQESFKQILGGCGRCGSIAWRGRDGGPSKEVPGTAVISHPREERRLSALLKSPWRVGRSWMSGLCPEPELYG